MAQSRKNYWWCCSATAPLDEPPLETGDVKRREGSGRPKSSRTENNINAVKELISSQDKPGTHATPNEISKMMDIPRTSIRKVLAEDLKLQPFKKIKGQRIDTRTKEKRINDAQTFSVFLRNKS